MSKRSPRLQFTDAERTSPELKLSSKLSHAVTATPINTALDAAHRNVRESEDDNVGVESAHKLEEIVEGGARTVESAHRSHKLKLYRSSAHAELRGDKTNFNALNKQARKQNTYVSNQDSNCNPYSRWQQKRAIKKKYIAAKATKTGKNTVKGTRKTARAAKTAVEGVKKSARFITKNWKGILIAAVILLIMEFFLSVMSSCSILVQGGVSALGALSSPADDADLLAAEARYSALEAELHNYIVNYESTASCDEYRYDLDDIRHDPYVLLAAISALHGGEWTLSEVDGIIQMLFDKQYILTETVDTETRYTTEIRTGTRTVSDPDTGVTTTEEYEYEVQIPYTYYICTVELENFDLSNVPVCVMNEEQLAMFEVYVVTLGNRPDLFPDYTYVD